MKDSSEDLVRVPLLIRKGKAKWELDHEEGGGEEMSDKGVRQEVKGLFQG